MTGVFSATVDNGFVRYPKKQNNMENNNQKARSEFFDNGHRISGHTLLEIISQYIDYYNATHSRCPIPQGDIDGVMSDIYTKAYTYEDRFDPNRASLRTWVSRIAKNCIVDYWETYWKQRGISQRTEVLDDVIAYCDTECGYVSNYGYDDDYYSCSSSTNSKIKTVDDLIDESDVESDFIKAEAKDRTNEWLYSHIELLSDRRRFVVEEVLKGTDRKEIANLLGCTKGAVDKLYFDAINALTEMLKADMATA